MMPCVPLLSLMTVRNRHILKCLDLLVIPLMIHQCNKMLIWKTKTITVTQSNLTCWINNQLYKIVRTSHAHSTKRRRITCGMLQERLLPTYAVVRPAAWCGSTRAQEIHVKRFGRADCYFPNLWSTERYEKEIAHRSELVKHNRLS